MSNVIITKLKTKKSYVNVIRDDLLSGGTKQRGIIPFITKLQTKGIEEVVYASPFCGFAQVALARACNKVNMKCTIVAERDPYTKTFSDTSKQIKDIAQIYLENTLVEAENIAIRYKNSSIAPCIKIPLGLNHDLFKLYFKTALYELWINICHQLDFTPDNVWIPFGSGTLAERFSLVITNPTNLICVDVGVSENAWNDSLIVKDPNIIYLKTNQPFHEPAVNLPEISSNKYYDAKLWDFVYNHAGHRDIWLNVGP